MTYLQHADAEVLSDVLTKAPVDQLLLDNARLDHQLCDVESLVQLFEAALEDPVGR